MNTTNNIESSKAAILAKAKADMEKAEKECAIIECLPIDPSFVHVYELYGRIATARYNVANKEEAANVFAAFPEKLPMYSCKNGNTKSIKAVPDEKDTQEHVFLFSVVIEKHSQDVNFYVQTPVGVVEIEISMGFSPYGSFYVADRHRTKYYRWEFKAENRLFGLLRVANYARVSKYGDMSAPHMIYAGFEHFEFFDSIGLTHTDALIN